MDSRCENTSQVSPAAQTGDEETTVDLQAIVTGVYDRAGYDLRIDCHQSPPLSPALSEAERQWVEGTAILAEVMSRQFTLL